MATTYPYKKSRYAWEYLVFIHALSKSADTKLSISAKDLTLDSLRLRLFQGRKFIEDSPSCPVLQSYQSLALTTTIKKFGVAQLQIIGDQNFAYYFGAAQTTPFFSTLINIDNFVADKSQSSYTSSSLDIPSDGWAAIGFYVNKAHNSLRVKTAFSTSIFLRK